MDKTIEVPQKKKGGWPLGKARSKKNTVVAAAAKPSNLIAKMKARPNWESPEFRGEGIDGNDRLHIDPDKVKQLHRDGVALQWVTRAVRGKEMPEETAKFLKGGWTPVSNDDFDGVLDGMFMPHGTDDVITVDDCMLVARPAEMNKRAQERQRVLATEPVESTEAVFRYGLSMPGGDHASVKNKLEKRFERISIPD
jgi:hypothetical protein